ncbi:hypothetical protein B5E53_09765 [Eubacterium sp. An11]|uniref:hypothetical protein n=1 Tax=Eubacterium sp. An11 TaxID=1965542 RepID=UPI000B374434|nr:hypothetical protein [Eubacterium sp. An11]OUQ66688.1 hypothetical protein B5E53_09765 [Eubacterium sp. An11]
MTGKDLYEAIHQCDDEYIEKTAEKIEKNLEKKDLSPNGWIPRLWRHSAAFRTAAAVLLCIVILGMSVSVLATASDAFREWLFDMFSGHEVTELNIGGAGGAEEGSGETSQPDIPADENQMLTLEEGMQIYGVNESFVCKVHYENDGEDEIVDKVYAIQGNGLRELPVYSFRGEYDGVPYSFEYAVIGNEVLGFNGTGDFCGLFHYKNGDIVYADLQHVGEDTIVQKECLVEINLRTEEVTKISNDKMICNFLMSPDGKIILCNHRSAEYWSVFDIAARTEKRIDSLLWYLHTDEIKFLDTYTVLAYGDSIETKLPDGSFWMDSQTYKIDLHTGEILEKYPGASDLDLEWDYKTEGNTLRFDNIVTGESFTIDGVDKNVGILSGTGSYFLFGYDEDDGDQPGTAYCLVNLDQQTFMKIHIPKELYFDVEMYLTVSEKKLLLTNGKEAYIVDVSELG